jgi:hypothetical protein
MDGPDFETRQRQEGLPLLQNIHIDCGHNPASYSAGTEVRSRGIKQPLREVDHTLSSSAEVKHGVIPPLPLYAFMAWAGTSLLFLTSVYVTALFF